MVSSSAEYAPMPPIEIYTTRYCPYCISAKDLLKRKGVAFTEIDVGGDRHVRAEMIERANGRMTVPQIFIGATHVGGCDDLYALERRRQARPAANGAAPEPPHDRMSTGKLDLPRRPDPDALRAAPRKPISTPRRS